MENRVGIWQSFSDLIFHSILNAEAPMHCFLFVVNLCNSKQSSCFIDNDLTSWIKEDIITESRGVQVILINLSDCESGHLGDSIFCDLISYNINQVALIPTTHIARSNDLALQFYLEALRVQLLHSLEIINTETCNIFQSFPPCTLLVHIPITIKVLFVLVYRLNLFRSKAKKNKHLSLVRM